jgi:peptidoglycan/xylan/chitin deacetylase (PgdA/CDA1 family)
MPSTWLAYHDVYRDAHMRGVPNSASSYHVSRRAFESHLDTIRDARIPVLTIEQSLVHAGRSVVITFDDGWLGSFENALPLLRERGMPAIFFITRDFVGRPGFCARTNIKQAAEAGCAVGVHGTTHRVLAGSSREEIVEEFKLCKEFLEDVTGNAVTAASAPLGESGALIRRCAGEAGLTFLCTSRPGSNDARTSRYELRRIALRAGSSLADLQRYCSGHFEKEYVRWVVVNASRRVLGEGNYARLVRLLLDGANDSSQLFELDLKHPTK